MARYQIVKGGTHSQYGRTYKRGDVLESSTDLVKIFPNRFIKVGAEVAEMTERVPRLARPEDALPLRRVPVAQENVEEVDVDAADKEPAVRPKGRDVTDAFSEAVENDFLVYRREKGYWVYDKDTLTKPLNGDALGKSAVKKFIREKLEV